MGEESIQARVIDVKKYGIYRIVRLQPLNSFEFKPGQNAEFEIGKEICGDCGSRTFSIASSPTEDYIMFATIARDSPYKKALDKLAPGDEIRIWGPYGHFTLDEGLGKAVLIFDTIGVTPARSMIMYSFHKKFEIEITAIHIDKQGDFLFREDLETVSRGGDNIDIIWEREIPGEEELKDIIGDPRKTSIYISGPPHSVREIVSMLRRLRIEISRERIKIESFSGY
jgi:ferredoxin-NADP reductase